ncbi:hypothetical protein RB195_009232 [Necator americanus]|uniref:Uncharacterized protein n=1 Tax=Necator americanus TaxID=51031 RepID=A0ABR1CVU2_NECAM
MHSGRCKENAPGFSIKEEVLLCIYGDNVHIPFCVCRTTGDFSQEKRLRRRLRRQLKRDRENEGTSRAKELEKAWEDKDPRNASC